MAKLKATNPLSGSSMDVSINGILRMLLGGVLIWGVVATSQNFARMIGSKVNNKYVDFTPDPITSQETKVVDQTVYMG